VLQFFIVGPLDRNWPGDADRVCLLGREKDHAEIRHLPITVAAKFESPQ